MKTEILKFDVPSRNGFVYRKETIEKAIDKIQGDIFVCLGNRSPVADISSIVGKIEKNSITFNKDNYAVESEIKILDLPLAKTYKTLIESGINDHFLISTGFVGLDENGQKMVENMDILYVTLTMPSPDKPCE